MRLSCKIRALPLPPTRRLLIGMQHGTQWCQHRVSDYGSVTASAHPGCKSHHSPLPASAWHAQPPATRTFYSSGSRAGLFGSDVAAAALCAAGLSSHAAFSRIWVLDGATGAAAFHIGGTIHLVGTGPGCVGHPAGLPCSFLGGARVVRTDVAMHNWLSSGSVKPTWSVAEARGTRR